MDKIINDLKKDPNKYIGNNTLYPESVTSDGKSIFLMARDNEEKYLFTVSLIDYSFEGTIVNTIEDNGQRYQVSRCKTDWHNLNILREVLPHLNPSTCSTNESFGTGDRLGLATPAHIRAFENKDIFPVIAQQSARELARTRRTWKDVMASAIWGYFESGSKIGFGADADHLMEEKDLKEAADAGFRMFTVDPSDQIIELAGLEKSDIYDKYRDIAEKKELEDRYLHKEVKIAGRKNVIDKDYLIPIAVRYMEAINRVSSLYYFLKSNTEDPFDFEVSMDEIEEPVAPLEHFFISNELKRSGIEFSNLALRFPGRWEKAVDHMGDPGELEKDLKAHREISKMFGGYKLSLHSGSEKFSAYPPFSKITGGNFHIKTAGTSYLEALRTTAETDPDLFRDIYNLSLKSFETDRDSYHLTTDISKLIDTSKVKDSSLKDYLDIRESRQILHVAFGTILTDPEIKDRLYKNLFDNEKLHYKNVEDNISKHLKYLS